MKAIIGISMSREEKPDNPPRDWVRETYINAVIKAGGIPVLLPNVEASVEALGACDGLLLTGGGDFHPTLFGQEDDGTDWSGYSEARDRVELLLTRDANRRQMPIFGICRGLQAMAVAYGGTLIQDIERRHPGGNITHKQQESRTVPTHEVSIKEGSYLARWLEHSQISVNSFHHQSVDTVPEGFEIVAQSPDGLIEAMENPKKPFELGVQWHPEDFVENDQRALKLFQAFVKEAVFYRERTMTRA